MSQDTAKQEPQAPSPGEELQSRGRPEVVLRFEYITARDMKIVTAAVQLATAAGVVSLITLVIFKLHLNDQFFRGDDRVQRANLVAGVISLTCCTSIWAWNSTKLCMAIQQKAVWSHRRWRGFRIIYTLTTVQMINLVFYVVPNAYTLARPGNLFSAVVDASGCIRWTCWNTIFLIFVMMAHNGDPWINKKTGERLGREDSIVMDAPLSYHWAKIIPWSLKEAVIITMVYHITEFRKQRERDGQLTQNDNDSCTPPLVLVLPTVLLTLFAMAATTAYLVYTRRAYVELRQSPYQKYRMGNVMMRLQLRICLNAFVFILVTLPVLWFTRIRNCGGYLMVWLGFMPMQIVVTAMVIVFAFMMSPLDATSTRRIRADVLQDFAWTQEQRHHKLVQRRTCPISNRVPLFCMEHALKAMYWCCLAYEYQAPDGPKRMASALALFGLEEYDIIHEPAHDTHALLGWGNNTIVLCFRGTASLANVLADLRGWRVPYSNHRRRLRRPMVHSGFWNSWRSNGLNDRIVERIATIIKGMERSQLRVVVAGHSLGGALATLAAMDIRKLCPVEPPLAEQEVCCYTLGAPRTGNHAFADEYDDTVPDTWHIINNQDMVAHGFKLARMYKRPGQRVLINSFGDIIVRPSPAEINTTKGPGGGSSVADHLLSTGYQRAFEAVLLAQRGPKALPGGAAGVGELSNVVEAVGLSLERNLPEWQELALVATLRRLPTRIFNSFTRRGNRISLVDSLAANLSCSGNFCCGPSPRMGKEGMEGDLSDDGPDPFDVQELGEAAEGLPPKVPEGHMLTCSGKVEAKPCTAGQCIRTIAVTSGCRKTCLLRAMLRRNLCPLDPQDALLDAKYLDFGAAYSGELCPLDPPDDLLDARCRDVEGQPAWASLRGAPSGDVCDSLNCLAMPPLDEGSNAGVGAALAKAQHGQEVLQGAVICMAADVPVSASSHGQEAAQSDGGAHLDLDMREQSAEQAQPSQRVACDVGAAVSTTQQVPTDGDVHLDMGEASHGMQEQSGQGAGSDVGAALSTSQQVPTGGDVRVDIGEWSHGMQAQEQGPAGQV